MKNRGVKQQETTAKCVICVAMRCAWKWLLAAGLVSLIIELTLMVGILMINGNEKQGDWATIWLGASFMACLIAGLASLLTYWKDVYNLVCDNLRCT